MTDPINLIGNNNSDYEEDREPLDTQGMLESAFLHNLKNPELATEAASYGEASETIQADMSMVQKLSSNERLAASGGTEQFLVDLYGVHDCLVSSFRKLDINSSVAGDISEQINKVASCIERLGGEVDSFDPLNHVSGLKAPQNLASYAKRVVDSTRQCYSLGSIADTGVSEDGRTIKIEFTGSSETQGYKATGTITAQNSWSGNEAIDYIYTPGSGRMSVKAYSNDGWVDKCDDFDIYWELEEFDLSELEETKLSQNIEKSASNSKEAEQNKSNNKDIGSDSGQDEETGLDFPIKDN
jgi:hypothetical protein